MEVKKIKCPVCGNEEMIEVQSPLIDIVEVSGFDRSKYYGCTQCSLILQFNEHLVKPKQTNKGKEVY